MSLISLKSQFDQAVVAKASNTTEKTTYPFVAALPKPVAQTHALCVFIYLK